MIVTSLVVCGLGALIVYLSRENIALHERLRVLERRELERRFLLQDAIVHDDEKLSG